MALPADSRRSYLLIASISCGDSAIRRASPSSSRCASELVPGIGRITGERARSQASAICDVEAPCLSAIAEEPASAD